MNFEFWIGHKLQTCASGGLWRCWENWQKNRWINSKTLHFIVNQNWLVKFASLHFVKVPKLWKSLWIWKSITFSSSESQLLIIYIFKKFSNISISLHKVPLFLYLHKSSVRFLIRNRCFNRISLFPTFFFKRTVFTLNFSNNPKKIG